MWHKPIIITEIPMLGGRHHFILKQSPCSNILNSSPTSAAYMHQRTWPSLVQVMACRHSATILYLNECRLIANWALKNILRRDSIQNNNKKSSMKMYLKMLSAKWRPFWPGVVVDKLNHCSSDSNPLHSAQSRLGAISTWLYWNKKKTPDCLGGHWTTYKSSRQTTNIWTFFMPYTRMFQPIKGLSLSISCRQMGESFKSLGVGAYRIIPCIIHICFVMHCFVVVVSSGAWLIKMA